MTLEDIIQAVKKAADGPLRQHHKLRFTPGFAAITDDAYLKAVARFHNNGHLLRIHEGYVYKAIDAN